MSTPEIAKIQTPKKSNKIPENALFDALQMSCCIKEKFAPNPGKCPIIPRFLLESLGSLNY